MNLENLIPVNQLCTSFKVEMSFFVHLDEFGLINITTVEQSTYVHQDEIDDIQKIIRLHHELDINLEGIDAILHLLKKVRSLQDELTMTQNRLRIYED